MGLKNIIGLLMLVLVFAGFFVATALDIGIKQAAMMWGTSILLTLFVAIATYLLTSD